ncbi:MAG TPA: hypothetical protein VIX82_08770 [Solirubrobacteraceae bacterium]
MSTAPTSKRTNVVDHEYEIKRNDETVATISKKWLRARDAYGDDIAAGGDTPLILAITLTIDSLTTGVSGASSMKQCARPIGSRGLSPARATAGESPSGQRDAAGS